MAVKMTRAKILENQVYQSRREFLLCRSYGHQWEPYDVTRTGKKVTVVIQCLRCETLAEMKCRISTAKGNERLIKGRRTLKYAPGYLMHGLGRLSKDDRDFVNFMALIVNTSGIKGRKSA